MAKKAEDIVYETDAAEASTTKAAPKAKYDFTKLNTLAVVSIASAVTGFGAAAAVITGHVSLSQIKKSGQKGRGLAIAGVAAGYAIIALWILSSIGFLALGILGARNGMQVPGFGNHDGNGMMGFGRHGDDNGQFQQGQFQQGQAGQLPVQPQTVPNSGTVTTQPSA